MLIRKAEKRDIEKINKIYDNAKVFMAKHGNPTQWDESYPTREIVENDVKKQISFVCEDNENVVGVFVLLEGDDPTYKKIENGKWLDESPYVTIHRLAASGEAKGVAKCCFDFAKSYCGHVRIDTHFDNHVMQSAVEKNGFIHTGTIYVDDGRPSKAYEFFEESKLNI